MVKEYLERYRDSLLEEKILCENDDKKLEQRLKENREFCSLLEKKNDPNFEAFTPHIVHSKDKEKIKELEAAEKEIIQKREELKSRISDLEKQLTELTSVITIASEQENTTEVLKNKIEKQQTDGVDLLSIEEQERKSFVDVMEQEIVSKIDDIIYKLNFCSKLLDVDAGRCKLEINSLSETAEKVKQELCEMKENIFIPEIENESDFFMSVQTALKKVKISDDVSISFQMEGEQWLINSVVAKVILYIIVLWIKDIEKLKVSKISVRLIYDMQSLNVEIVDDREEDNIFVPLVIKRYVALLSGRVQICKISGEKIMMLVNIPRGKEVENNVGKNYDCR